MSTGTHNNDISVYFIRYFNDRFPSNTFFDARLYFAGFKAVMIFLSNMLILLHRAKNEK
jgi:hypothetical protein